MGEQHDETGEGADRSEDEVPGRADRPDRLPGALPPPPDRVPRNPWAGVGAILAIVLILLGLGLIGVVVLFFVSLSSWGSHK